MSCGMTKSEGDEDNGGNAWTAYRPGYEATLTGRLFGGKAKGSWEAKGKGNVARGEWFAVRRPER